jgi:hypothetical protein
MPFLEPYILSTYNLKASLNFYICEVLPVRQVTVNTVILIIN